MSRLARIASLALITALAGLAVADQAKAGGLTFVVNDTADANLVACSPASCSLRQAIEAANMNPGHDTITFDDGVFPTGLPNPTEIIALTPLPAINASQGITIDAEPNSVRLVSSGGSAATPGLLFTSGVGQTLRDVTVRGIFVTGFQVGIYICPANVGGQCTFNATNVDIDGVLVTDHTATGVLIIGVELEDVRVLDSTARNNPEGIEIRAITSGEGITVRGNLLEQNMFAMSVVGADDFFSGVDIDNNSVLQATSSGIQLHSDDALRDSAVRNNQVIDAGSAAIDVYGQGSLSNVDVLSNNVLSSGSGIYATASGPVSDLLVESNNVDEVMDAGIWVQGDRGQLPSMIRGNTVQDAVDGIYVSEDAGASAIRATISRNTTAFNTQLGIDLAAGTDVDPGVTLNDAGDGDSGANDLQNFPVITGSDGQFVRGTTCGLCTVELFRSDEDPSGYGEGQIFVADGVADASGDFAVSICDQPLSAGHVVTTTATNPQGSTSEFSLNYGLMESAAPCPKPTPSPTASASPSPTPSETPVPTPTSTPGAKTTQGDVDCDGDIDSVDALKVLRHVASLSVTQAEPCDDIGTGLGRIGAAGTFTGVGDVDCDLDVDSVDALKILRHVASLSVQQTEPCRNIGVSGTERGA